MTTHTAYEREMFNLLFLVKLDKMIHMADHLVPCFPNFGAEFSLESV